MLLKSFLLLLVLLSSFFFSSSREIFETLVKECVLRNLLLLLEPQNASFTPRSRDDHFPTKDETMGEDETEEERNDMMSVSLFSKALIFICSF